MFLVPPHLLPTGRTLSRSQAPNADLPLSIIFIRTKKGCREGLSYLRRLLPPHLRSSLDSYTSAASQIDRRNLLERFQRHELRILFATEAFGVGCDVPEIEHGIQFGNPDSLVQLDQHIGRAGRSWQAPHHTRLTFFANRESFGPCKYNDTVSLAHVQATDIKRSRSSTPVNPVFRDRGALYSIINPPALHHATVSKWNCRRKVAERRFRPGLRAFVQNELSAGTAADSSSELN